MSGVSPSCSQANSGPVRPKPVITSSTANRMSRSRQVCCIAVSQPAGRSEEHTSELQSLMRPSYAVFCLKKKNKQHNIHTNITRKHTDTPQRDNRTYATHVTTPHPSILNTIYTRKNRP